MNWAEVIIEGLPPLRGDEPRSLRGDIADELADHLACALKRELRRTDDEAAAERNVLERFGNPTAIARRLWWDAMKESIMKERITIGIMAGFLLLAAVAAVFTWQALREGRQVNTAILAKLEQLAKPSEPAKPGVSENWTKVVVRATVEGSGAPKPGLTMQLAGAAFSEKSETLFASTDAEGSATFGPIRPGRYSFNVYDNPGQTTIALASLSTRRELTLYPGQTTEIALTYPAVAYTEVSLRIAGELPKPEDMLSCTFEGAASIKAGKDEWVATGWPQVWVKTNGELLVTRSYQPQVGRSPEGLNTRCSGEFQTGATLRMPATKYLLKRLELARPVPGRSTSELCWAECGWLQMDRPGGEGSRPPGPMGGEPSSPRRLLTPEFNATAEKNEWRIEVPAELLAEYQKTLERAAEAQKHPVPPPGGPMGGGMMGGAMPPPGGPMGGGMMGSAMPPPLPGQPARPVMSGSRPAAASRPSR